MTDEHKPEPIIPAHATTFPASGGFVSVYRDGEFVTMVSQYRGGSYMLRMDREGSLLIASAILQHATVGNTP
jgi:hypothetical protein